MINDQQPATSHWRKYPDDKPNIGTNCLCISKNGFTHSSVYKNDSDWVAINGRNFDIEWWAEIFEPKD